MCDTNKEKEFNSIEKQKQYIIDNQICKNLDNQMLQAVSIYLYNPLLASLINQNRNIPEMLNALYVEC